jgi:hypothetical protein
MNSLREIRALIRRHAGGAAILPGISLRSATATTELSNTLVEPAFALIAQGDKRAILGERVFDYGAGQFLVVSVDLPISAQIVRATPQKPYLAFAMTLKPAVIAGLLLESGGFSRAGPEPTGLAISDGTPALLDPILRLLRLVDHLQDIAVLLPMLEREILWRLLNGEQGWMVRQIGLADSSLSQIGRAIRLDPRALRRELPHRRSRTGGAHEPRHFLPPFPRRHGHEPPPVSEADSPAECSRAADCRRS